MPNRPSAFRSLRLPDYRLWAAGALVSNVGTWMQRTAQDWLVLTHLTAHNATSVGIVMSLQFGPQLLLLPWTGLAADRFDRRRLMLVTQTLMGLLALTLGVLTLTGTVQLWHVYLLALGLGCVSAFDTPARQTFVTVLVDKPDLPNAIALNSASFNAARLIGPAAAGLLIAAIGTGWLFVLNALSYAAVLVALLRLRVDDTRTHGVALLPATGLIDGVRYLRARPELATIMVMLFLFCAFGLNFPIYISTMSVRVFQVGAERYGLLTSTMAVGSVFGALLAARREQPRLQLLVIGAAVFGIGCGLAALMPDYRLFALCLVVVGVAAQTFNTSANALVQLASDSGMRGRVMSIFLAISIGTTPLGAPLVGWVADTAGPRWALGVAAAAGLGAALIGWFYLRRRSVAELTLDL